MNIAAVTDPWRTPYRLQFARGGLTADHPGGTDLNHVSEFRTKLQGMIKFKLDILPQDWWSAAIRNRTKP